MKNRDVQKSAKLDALRAAVSEGIVDVEQGNFKEFACGAELAAYLKARRKEAR